MFNQHDTSELADKANEAIGNVMRQVSGEIRTLTISLHRSRDTKGEIFARAVATVRIYGSSNPTEAR